MTTPSPLGRYAAPGPDTGVPVEVRLLALPVRVLAAAREHHDALLRECRLLALEGLPPSAPPRLAELAQVLGVQYAAATRRPDEAVDAALDRGDDTVDLAYPATPEVAAAAQRLDDLMAEADALSRQGQLMTLERSPVLRAFAQWYLQQFTEQVRGRPAQPWDGPVDA